MKSYWLMIAYVFFYVVFNCVYTLGYNDIIYDVLDWKSGGTAVWIIVALILANIMHFLFLGSHFYLKKKYVLSFINQ
jgi:hypothetical protein